MGKGFFQKLFGSEDEAYKTNPAIYKMGEPLSLSKYDLNSILSENCIITEQTRLAFPTDEYRIKYPEKDADKDIIFEFRDINDMVYGKYRYVRTEVKSFDFDKLIDLYTKEMIDNIVSKTVYKTFIDGREAFVVTGKIKDKTYDYFSLIVIEGSNLTIFSLTTNENFLFLNPDQAYKMFASYKFVRDKYHLERIFKDFLCFKVDNAAWMFIGDSETNRKGYHVLFKDPDGAFKVLIGAKENFFKTIKEMRENITENEVEYFEDKFTFSGKEVTCQGFFHNSWVNYYLNFNGRKLEFYFSVTNLSTDSKMTMEEMRKPEVWNKMLNAFNEGFYFNF